MATITKNSKTIKITIFSRTARYFWLKFCMKYKKHLDVDWYQNEKKSIAELGHNGRWKIYVSPEKIYIGPRI